jgi:hypothetical protein
LETGAERSHQKSAVGTSIGAQETNENRFYEAKFKFENHWK